MTMHLPARTWLVACAVTALAAAGLVASPASAVPPPNDDFAAATGISAYDVYSTDNTEATIELGEPLPSCAYAETGPGPYSDSTVWFAFVAPATEDVTLHTRGSLAGDTQIAVYTGDSFGTLAEVACNEDIDAEGQNFQSELVFPADAGTTYMVQLATWTDGQDFHGQGPIDLTVTNESTPVGPENDSSVNALPLTPGITTGSTVGATEQAGEEQLAADTGCDVKKTIWYVYSPVDSGPASIDLGMSDFDTTIAYLEADPDFNLVGAGCDDDGGTGTRSLLGFNAVAGNVYYFQVGSVLGEEGNAVLDFSGPEGGSAEGDVVVSGTAAKAAGTQVSWTIDVAADGLGGPDGVLFLDPPSGVTIGSVTSPDMFCEPGTPLVCFSPPMGPNQTFSVTVLATPRNEGPFTLDAAWQPGGGMPRSGGAKAFVPRADDPANNSAQVTASRKVVCDNKPTAKANSAKGTGKGDILCGLGGADTLKGLDGNDLIFGGDGADQLLGGAGKDRVLGGAGGDDLVGGGGQDTLDGGGGKDRCRESADTQTSCER